MKKYLPLLIMVITLASCKDDEDKKLPEETNNNPETALYFPPETGEWETTAPESLGWNTDSIAALYDNLELNGTRAFIVLKDGKIVLEKYWGKTILRDADFDARKNWYWASAAKTMTAFAVGKAEEDGHLSLTDKSSDYLGQGWTSLTKEQEDKITVQHQLSMTTGMDDTKGDGLEPENLTYISDAGTRWSYHNAPYTLLENVVSNATGQDYTTYFNSVLQDKIGMSGYWQWSGDLHLYLSNARSMARFGLLMQNRGVWDDTRIINESFVDAAIRPSQNINKSYGYLWWLNGGEGFMIPQSQLKFPGTMLPNAPTDIYSGLGKNGQYVCISPSDGLVIIRMGDSPDNSLVPVNYLNDIWRMMNNVRD